MTDSSDYVPPKVWTWNKPSGGAFASINRPIAGATHEKDLRVVKHPLPRLPVWRGGVTLGSGLQEHPAVARHAF